MVELNKKIEIAFKEDDTKPIKKFLVTVKINKTEEDDRLFEEFKKNSDAKYDEKINAGKEAKKLKIEIQRLEEDIEDISIKISNDTDDIDATKIISLTEDRSKLRAEKRIKQDRLAQLEDETTLADLQKLQNELLEGISKKQFELFVLDNDKREELITHINENKISYQIIMNEIIRLMGKAKEKK